MSSIPTPIFPLFFFLLVSTIFSPISSTLPNPQAVTIQQLPISSTPPATIPAFPEQSNVAGCPLDLPDQLFHSIHSACAGQLERSRCCPVLAAWLYAAYSSTALGQAGSLVPSVAGRSPSYDLPLLPDDSETCVNDLGKALRQRGIELSRPNMTCDVVYCYCGIRLHPLSCPDTFWFDQKGKLVGDESVERLERDCLTSSINVNGFPGLGGCNKCLNTMHLLKKNALNSSKSDDDSRTTKMRNKDCQLMGLTWLLSKNRTAYIHTVSAVLRAIMASTDDGVDPTSCILGSDGMPLAVDSTDFSGQSSSTHLSVLFILLSVLSLSLSLAPLAVS